MARRATRGFDLKPGPFFKAAASRLDFRSRRGFPVTVAGIVAALSFLGFLSIAEDVLGAAPWALDTFAAHVATSWANPVCTAAMWVLTLMGDVRVMVVETIVAAVLLAVWGHPRRAGSVVVLVLTGVGVSETLKGFIQRPRPDAALALLANPGSSSFPSGHALAGVLLFGTLALMLAASPRVSRTLRIWGTVGTVFLATGIGLSRVYLGVHFLSDVLASWLLGTTMLAAWAAAVLVWGRTQPPPEERVVHPWGRLWWRWALTGAGVVAVLIAIVAETGVTPLR
jgi:undecaprenyl-diphosphatase